MNNRPHRLWVLLALIVAASFAVRVAALAYWQTGAIENEGAEYASIAENLLNGVGFVGMALPGKQLIFNPLFPLLIAGTSVVTHDYEWAARLVSLVLGALLPLPVFGIASRLFNRRVGFIAATLTSLHPLLINLSFTAFSEGPYTTLLLSAAYAVVCALNHSSVRKWLLVGGAFGLAYLLRAEAVAALLIAMLFALIATTGRPAVRVKYAAAAIAAFLVLALPEMIFIYRATGEVRLEGKSAFFFAIGSRILAAKTSLEVDRQLPDGQHDNEPSDAPDVGYPGFGSAAFKWAHWAIDAHLNGTGIAMRSNEEVIRETRTSLKELLPMVVESVRLNAPNLLDVLSSKWLVGAPFLPALALLGALRRPWRRPQASSRLFVMLVALAPVVATFSALWRSAPRNYFVLIPFLLIWASNGLIEVGLWMKATSAAAGWGVMAGRVSVWIIPSLIGLAIIISPVKGVRKLYHFTEGSPSTRVEKDVGLWIRHQQNRPVRIMDVSLVLAYHAGAQLVPVPYCTPELALRFLEAAQPDYVVLRKGKKFTQYYEDWLTQGIPDPRAELLNVPLAADTGEFIIFRWHRGG